MQWLLTLLLYLFPRDPVRQAAEAARHGVAQLVHTLSSAEALAALHACTASRAYIEAIINDYEATVRLAIALRACQIAGIRCKPGERPFHQPSNPKSVAVLLKRIEALVAMCNDIERLAQLRAIALKREHDADPLTAHGSTDAWLLHAAHHEAGDVATGIVAQLGLNARATNGPPHSIAGATP
jgi:hypothetical protein